MTEDDELQAWLDAQEPVIDEAHVRAKRKELRALRPPRSFEEQRADLQYAVRLNAYAKAINLN